MRYPVAVQLLIDDWNNRVGGLVTLRILADALEECGEDRLALACRDAVVWFESEMGSKYLSLTTSVWFDPNDCRSRLTVDEWMEFATDKPSPWRALELYAEYPPLGTVANNNRSASYNGV